MTAAVTLTWPSSRTLAGWWPLLSRRHPQALWLHHLRLHRVEALVHVRGPLDPLHSLLLESLTFSPDRPVLDPGLEPSLVARLLADLSSAGLATRAPTGEWSMTDRGREVLAGRDDVCTVQERRDFHFAEGNSRYSGLRFLPLDSAAPHPAPVPIERLPVLQALTDCLARTPEWKQGQGFPADVRGLVDVATAGARAVAVVRPEQLLILAVQAGEELFGFAVQPGTWQLQAESPVLRLGAAWREALPELAEEPDPEAWRQAWRNWGQPRSLPMGELEACHLERMETRLRIRAPRPLIERLRATRSDAIKGEVWLLAGDDDRTRKAALVELAEE